MSAADALTARSEAYQAGKSHGAARFFKGLFSLGINELWRFSNYRSYESDKAKIVNCVKDVYAALAPKLGTQNLVVTFYEDENYSRRNDAALGSTPHVKNETAGLLAVLDARLGVQDAPRAKTMMQCLVEVVKQNVNARLLMTIGVANVGGMLATLQNDPLYQAANGGNNNGQVIIQP